MLDAKAAAQALCAELDSLQSLVRKLAEFMPGTYGEAVQAGVIEHGECANHEWDNRTYAENVLWLLQRRTAQRDEARAALAEANRRGDEDWTEMLKQRNEAVAELARYKEAVTDQLHYDMKKVISETPERRALLEKFALEARVAELEAEIADAFKAHPSGSCISGMVKVADLVRDMEENRVELRYGLHQCQAALLVMVDLYAKHSRGTFRHDEGWQAAVAKAHVELGSMEKNRILQAVAREKPDALPLVSRLLGVPACDGCGNVKDHCECRNKGEDR